MTVSETGRMVTYAQDSNVRAAFFDIDGTLTTGGEVWTGLLKSPEVSRLRIAWLQATAVPHYLLSKTGLVSQAGFRDRWVRLMAWLMTGWPGEQVQAIYDQTVRDYLVPALRSNVVGVLKQHKAAGHHVALVSTMFEEIVSGLAAYLDADAGLGSRVEMRDGQCTGRIVGQTCAGVRKVDFIRAHVQRLLPGVSLDVCAAYADSKSDIAFLADMGKPVATYPDDAMRAAALEHGWWIYPEKS